MHAEDFVVDESSNWHAVEYVLELLPNPNAIASLTLVVEAVHSVDLTTLVVSSQKEEVLLILYLVCKEQNNCLEGLLASVHIIAQEKIVGLWWESTILEKSQQVWELSVSVTY